MRARFFHSESEDSSEYCRNHANIPINYNYSKLKFVMLIGKEKFFEQIANKHEISWTRIISLYSRNDWNDLMSDSFLVSSPCKQYTNSNTLQLLCIHSPSNSSHFYYSMFLEVALAIFSCDLPITSRGVSQESPRGGEASIRLGNRDTSVTTLGRSRNL